MSRSPRVTGPTLLPPSKRTAFPFSASKAVITSYATRMAEARLYPGQTIGPGLFHKIIRDCQLTAAEFGELLKKG